MNIIFSLVIVISTVILLFTSPNLVFSAFISSGEKALTLTAKITITYAIWLGLFEIINRTGLSEKLARLLKPANNLLFGKLDDKSNDYISLNMSANILGMSGATTPMGIKAIRELEKHPNTEYAIAMFFVINATSIQLIPSSVLALRTQFNSVNPANIVVPTIITTLMSSIIGIVLVRIFIKK